MNGDTGWTHDGLEATQHHMIGAKDSFHAWAFQPIHYMKALANGFQPFAPTV
jgi:hypothetical protein